MKFGKNLKKKLIVPLLASLCFSMVPSVNLRAESKNDGQTIFAEMYSTNGDIGIMPFWAHTAYIDLGVFYHEGNVWSSVVIVGQAQCTAVEVTIYLQKFTAAGFTTIKAWSRSELGRTLVFEEPFASERGAMYRVYIEATIYADWHDFEDISLALSNWLE